MMKTNKLGLYIHIPFCERKCNYCGFFSFDKYKDKDMDCYLSSLINEIKIYGKNKYIVDTIFIGGGTPSSLMDGNIKKIMDSVKENFLLSEECEISIETNPNSVTEKKLREYKDAGINRLSMGLQSTNNSILASIGRLHTVEEFKKKYNIARQIGINNINIDIMFALPNQSFEMWQQTVREAILLNPEHISFYSLQLEEGTKLYEDYRDGKINIPSNAIEEQMYDFAINQFTKAGYHHYEFSNCAKIGKECRHNIKYWELKEFVGLGLSSSSFFQGHRYENTRDLKEYFNCKELPINKNTFIKETKEEQMKIYVMTGLRKTSGINLDDFCKEFNVDFFEAFKDVRKIVAKHKDLELMDNILKINRDGIKISNNIIEEFL